MRLLFSHKGERAKSGAHDGRHACGACDARLACLFSGSAGRHLLQCVAGVLQVCCNASGACDAQPACLCSGSAGRYLLQIVADVLQVCCDASGVCDAQLACVFSRETFAKASPPPDRLHTRTIDILKSELKSDFA